VIPEFKLDGITVSSTYIRGLISEGDIERANRFLGHPFCITGRVQDGRHVGRMLGTPTINLKPPADMVLPPNGVYATKVTLNGTQMNAVTNVGVRPTFDDGKEITVESFILDFSGDIYGSEVSVSFHAFLRPERRFANPEELSAQIHADALEAKRILTEVGVRV
jgi:riboflavin kinase/FMN adenylyltransferase